MKVLQSSLIRALSAIVVGLLLIKYREQTVTWITIVIGILFFISGVVSCIAYAVSRKQKNQTQVFDSEGNQLTGITPSFPLVGLGSLVLGLILVLMPATFVKWLIYLLSAILMLGAVGQFFTLVAASRIARIGFYFWIMPSVILLVSLVALVRPSAIASAPLFVIGWCMVLYGVVECVNTIKVHRMRKFFEQSGKSLDNKIQEQ